MKHQNRVHFPIDQKPVHFTYRLYGSIPKGYDEKLKLRMDSALDIAKAEALKYSPGLGDQFLNKRVFEINARYELGMDKYLHKNSNGPYYLSKSYVASEILQSYQYLHDNQELFVYTVCVMSNHVHALVRAPDGVEKVDSGLFMSRHKSYTARMCNKLLGRTGKPFWEDDYFDRTVRKGKFDRVIMYVLNNPVKAGLVKHWREWPHSWLNPEFELLYIN
jgi:REP element-mobilizing transposase RayT